MSTTPGGTLKKLIAVLVAIIGALALTAPASAHVSVNPGTAEQGSYAKLSFRVPNERDVASTTKLEVTIPADKGIRSVSIQPLPGWTYETEKSGDIVSKVTWTAAAGSATKPGEFQEFSISAGPLPKDSTSVLFKALQTYSDGEVVRWIEEQAPGGPEPEHPAPTLTLTPASSTSHGGHGASPSTTAVTAEPEQTDDDDNGSAGLAIAISVISLLVAATSAALAIRRKRS